MVQITVYVAALNVNLQGPPPFLLGGLSLSNYLNGPPTPGGPAIQVLLDSTHFHALPNTGPPGTGVSQQQLYTALGQLLNQVGQTPGPAIGLILVPFYATYPAAEGFMFDTVAIAGAPFGARQGCALFLNAIEAAAGPNLAAQLDRLTFQAIHELGHALNLWHIQPFQAGPNFMSAPPPSAVGPGNCNFVGTQMAFLSHALDPINQRFVLPGGSNFDVRGPLAPAYGGVPYAVDIKASDLTLRIALSHKKFYAIEPVELDVSLGIAKHAKSSKLEIPEEIDPGYARLKLWITAPNGEKRIYKATAHYCPTGRMLRITKAKPFQRDLSVFRSGNGYTFAEPGRYSMIATLQLGPGRTVKSNMVIFDVEALPLDSQEKLAVLWRPDAVALLQWKNELPSAELDTALSEQATTIHRPITSAHIHYALGRSREKTLAKDGNVSQDERRKAREHLSAALRMKSLGRYRAAKARRAYKALSEA